MAEGGGSVCRATSVPVFRATSNAENWFPYIYKFANYNGVHKMPRNAHAPLDCQSSKAWSQAPQLVRRGPPLVQRSIVEVSAAPLDCQSLGLKPKPPFLPTGLVIKCSLMALIPAKVGSVIFITDPVIEILPGVRQGFWPTTVVCRRWNYPSI